ncbi:MAG: hypothetical protein KGZ79_13955 [Dethiobacter sp.]|jgi:hypothetical protein|nr:hypothetical protein [Dethiobacter sp.]
MEGPNNHEDFLLNRLNHRVARLLQELDKFNIAEYMELLNNPRRFFWVNFLGGVGRGLGAALGATVFGAFVIFVLQRVVVLNLPLIGDFIAEIVRIVQSRM